MLSERGCCDGYGSIGSYILTLSGPAMARLADTPVHVNGSRTLTSFLCVYVLVIKKKRNLF